MPVKKPLPRDLGLINGDMQSITIIYECKDECETIIDSKHILEM